MKTPFVGIAAAILLVFMFINPCLAISLLLMGSFIYGYLKES